MNQSQEPGSPIPQWIIALPMIGAVVAAIIVVSGQPGPLTLAIFFLSLFALGYLYFYLIGIWRRRRSKHGEAVNLNQQERALPISRWIIALPAIGAMVAAILFVSGHTGALTLALFFVSIFAFGCVYLYLIRVWGQAPH